MLACGLLAQAGPTGPAECMQDRNSACTKTSELPGRYSIGFYVLGAQGPPYFLHGPAHSIRLLWFPILGLIGPYVMRPLLAFNCISSQVASPEEPPRPNCFLSTSWLPSWYSGRWFPLIPFIPYYPVPARDQA